LVISHEVLRERREFADTEAAGSDPATLCKNVANQSGAALLRRRRNAPLPLEFTGRARPDYRIRNMVPFRYVEFCDVPKAIVLRYKAKLLLLDSPFDNQLDEYPDSYSVYMSCPARRSRH
jgi:hypothetical protein